MFTEMLRIKPILDGAAAKVMELTLNQRFQRVAKRFGGGLMAIMKGTVLGISLGLLNRLLNPIEALEDKIKSLLGQGTDIRDLADEFNTSPGQIKRLQDVAQSIGVQPDQLKEMLKKFQDAITNAKQELADPFVKPSEQTQAVRNFVGEKDMAEGFFKFLQSLKAEGTGQGRTVLVGDPANGLTRQLTGAESRQQFEKAVFGEQLRGAQRRLVDTDFNQQLLKLNEPSAQKLSNAVNKTASLAEQQRILQTRNENQDFLNASGILNQKMIADMAQAQANEQAKLTKQLQSYDDLRKAADGIEKLKTILLDLSTFAAKGVGYLGVIADWVEKFKGSPLLRGIFGRGN